MLNQTIKEKTMASDGEDGGDWSVGGGSSDGGRSDSYSETTNTSWFTRIGNAFKGILAGLVLLVISFPLLFWNEGRAVTAYRSLSEGEGAVVPVPAEKVDPANENKLVHLTGKATSTDKVKDADFGIEIAALRLQRKAEIFQWKETEKSETSNKLGGGQQTKKTYSYDRVWSAEPINSGNFKQAAGHENSGTFDFGNTTINASKVTVGAFLLPESLVNQLGNFKPLGASEENLKKAASTVSSNWKVASNSYYKGKDPSSPAIGDQRVSFAVVNPEEVSLFAQQTGETLRTYQTKAGGKLERIELGNHSALEMFKNAQSENTLITWILRLVGWVLMTVGISLMFAPLVVLADVVPFLGTLTGYGVNIFAGIIALGLALITIGVAWVYYRPMLGYPLLGIGGGLLLYYIYRCLNSKKAV